jgi:hypothetical protein
VRDATNRDATNRDATNRDGAVLDIPPSPGSASPNPELFVAI